MRYYCKQTNKLRLVFGWLPTCFLRLRFLVLELTVVLIIVYRYVRSIRAVLCSMTDIYSGCPFAGTFLHLTLAQVTKCAQPVDEGSWDICTAQSAPAFGGARERRAVFSASRCKAWKLPSQGHRKLSRNHPRWAVSVVASVKLPPPPSLVSTIYLVTILCPFLPVGGDK